MNVKLRKIEVDEATASVLEARAAASGLTVSELVAEMTALHSAPIVLSAEDITDLDRQWAAIKAGEPTVPHEDIVRWLHTWGTPGFEPWQNQ